MTRTLLIADDSDTIRRVVEMAMKVAPLDVVGAATGDEALEIARSERPEAILLDYHLPDITGYDLCADLKNDSRTEDIPVVLMAGSHWDFEPDRAQQAGADDIIAKPFDTDLLLDTVSMTTGLAKRALVRGDVDPTPRPQTEPLGPDAIEEEKPAAPPEEGAPAAGENEPPAPPPGSEPSADGASDSDGPDVDTDDRFDPAETVPASGAHGEPDSTEFSSPHESAPRPEAPPAEPNEQQTPNDGSTDSPAAPDAETGGTETGRSPEADETETGPTADSETARPDPSSRPASARPRGGQLTRSEVEEMIDERVKQIVRERLPDLLQKVIGELVEKKVLPELADRTEQQVERTLDDRLDDRVRDHVEQVVNELLRET